MNPSLIDYTQAQELRELVEREVLAIIKNLSELEGTTKEQIQGIARRTLELIRPGMKIDELYQNIVKLDDNHPELAPVVLTVMREYEEKYAKKALTQVSQLVKDRQFDEAESIIKKVLHYKIIS